MEAPKTPRGEAYRAGYLKQAGQKLFIPRTAEGDVDTATISGARELENQFRHYPELIGVVARGSRMRGFGQETSDRDTALLFDSLYEILAVLCEPAVGDRVTLYREEIGKRLRMFEAQELEHISRDIVNQALQFDSKRTYKIAARIMKKDMRRNEEVAYLKKRRELWMRCVHLIYNLPQVT